ncbi:bifunctional phosphoribosylaminoimidazolecarboxamide formyltransferase/IMP cyclohydrolase [Dehalococcoidia bacterium]|nr:bifunctional phosphoribosylaminoimidazolecarboxamide formyltransferase/IMP cyclohydrolase [Dehalococcoidia bacterium]
MRALLSVSDKQSISKLGLGLIDLGWDIISTGGTKRNLVESGVKATGISDITGFPEIMDGRVKTLHPLIHGGILARRDNDEDRKQMEQHGIETIDLVAVNLYPFRNTVSDGTVSLENALEEIDIGGPTLLRAAAKNFPSMIVITDPADYDEILRLIEEGSVPLEKRRQLAQKAFQHVASYDSVISQYLVTDHDDEHSLFPIEKTIALEKSRDLRYGENPHQKAALYRTVKPQVITKSIANAEQHGGRELSFNNILDADSAWSAVNGFIDPAVAIIKHTNPCGLSTHEDLPTAYRGAFSGDPVSAYGGIVASNKTIDQATAEAMSDVFYEIVIAPGFEPAALEILRKKKNLRILSANKEQSDKESLEYREITGGFLVQTVDSDIEGEWKTATKREPTEEEMTDLKFAWKAVRFVKSNAILLAKNKTILGIGAGQPNRVTSVGIALERAGNASEQSVLASDAFFPFADGIETAAKGGVTAIIQPGGSIRDEECIKAADDANIAMIFTGVRHFRH